MLDESEPLARAEYARALVLIGGREAIPALQRSAAHGPWEARQYAIGALGMLGDERDQPTMDRIAADEPKATASDCKRYGCNLPVDEVAANRLKTVKVFQAPLKAAAQCKAAMDCWVSKLGDAEGPVRQRAALELGRTGKSEAVKPLGDHLADKEPETRAAVLQALMWLVQGDAAAARQLVPLLPRLEQQVSVRPGPAGLRGDQRAAPAPHHGGTSPGRASLSAPSPATAAGSAAARRPPWKALGSRVEGQHLGQRDEQQQPARRGEDGERRYRLGHVDPSRPHPPALLRHQLSCPAPPW